MNGLSECLAKIVTSYSHSIKQMIPILCKLGAIIEVAMLNVGKGFDTERESRNVLLHHYYTITGFVESYPELFDWYPKWKEPFAEFQTLKIQPFADKESLNHTNFYPFLIIMAESLGMNDTADILCVNRQISTGELIVDW